MAGFRSSVVIHTIDPCDWIYCASHFSVTKLILPKGLVRWSESLQWSLSHNYSIAGKSMDIGEIDLWKARKQG